MTEILQGFGGTADQAARAVSLLKSLSHEGRLQILCLLVDGEMSVTQLAEALGSSPSERTIISNSSSVCLTVPSA